MKQYSKKLFSLAVLCGTAASVGMLHADNDNGNRVVPFLQWRSQGREEARKLYGTTSYAVYQNNEDANDGWFGNGTFNVTIQYDQSFRGKQIAQALFGPAIVENYSATGTTTTVTTGNCNKSCNDDCGHDSIVISGMNAATIGTATTNRLPNELMAENFLLPRDFRSVITFSPKVQDVVVDFNLYVGFERWCSGLYFRLYGPVVWNRATLKPCENIISAGTAANGSYTEGFFDPLADVPIADMFTSALNYFGGCQFPGGYTGQSVSVQPLRFAKFSNCNLPTTSTTALNNCNNSCDDDCNSFRRHKTGFAELRGEFGYNYIADKYRFLINLQAAAPTGTKVKAEYLFPAQVGNGHHWELGVGLGGAWRMWCNEEMERSFNFIVEADITHLFKAKQQRTFDLKCKPLSRYMLAEQLVANEDLDASSILVGDSDGGFQFGVLDPNVTPPVAGGVYAPVANFSTRNVKVSIGVQGDLVAMFNYTARGFSWDLGYNFWAMSSSKISLRCDEDCPDACGILPFPTNFALKGDASVAGYSVGTGTPTDPEFIVGLGATETGTDTTLGATIFTGTNGAPVTAISLSNPNIDNPELALFNPTGTAVLALNAFGTINPISTSVDPVFISIDDLDIKGAEQRGLSHKVFTHLSYTWRDCSDRWMPYVGAGVSAEFGSHSSNDDCSSAVPTLADCNDCGSSYSFALSKWAVEIKGGVSFH